MFITFTEFQESKKTFSKGEIENKHGIFDNSSKACLYFNGYLFINILDDGSFYLLIDRTKYFGEGEEGYSRLEKILFSYATKNIFFDHTLTYVIFSKDDSGYSYIYTDDPECNDSGGSESGFDSLVGATIAVYSALNITSFMQLPYNLVIDTTVNSKEYSDLESYERIPWLTNQ